MSGHCVDCGSSIPDNQGARTCSMCYGDPNHGKDGYYRQWQDSEREREERRDDLDREERESEEDAR
jgi:hypothetical protein